MEIGGQEREGVDVRITKGFGDLERELSPVVQEQ